MGLFSSIRRSYQKARPTTILYEVLLEQGYGSQALVARRISDAVLSNFWNRFELTLNNQADNTSDPIMAICSTFFWAPQCNDDDVLSDVISSGREIADELMQLKGRLFITDLDKKLLLE